MASYVKIKLYNKRDTAFVANAIIVKYTLENHRDIAHWSLVWKDNLPIRPDTTASGLTFNDLTIRSEGTGGIKAVQISISSAYDSYETLLISERLRTDSVFSNYRVILGDEVFTDNSGVFSVVFDDLFVVESHAAAAIGGVLIKSAYTQRELYSGFSEYHHNQRVHSFNTPLNNDKPYRIGVELEVYANSSAAKDSICGARTNWFQCEKDGSLSESIHGVSGLGVEIKTIPLRPCDATSVDFWAEPMAKLGKLAVSKGHSTTGLHVHISKEILGANENEREKNLNKLLTFYTYFIEENEEAHRKNVIICGRERGYSDEKPNTEIGDFASMFGIEKICQNERCFNLISVGVKNKCEGQRADINLKHWNDYGTIEFRKGDGRISKTRLAAICTWWEQMCLYCKETHPAHFSFDDFFNKVCREYPAVAYFFQVDDER